MRELRILGLLILMASAGTKTAYAQEDAKEPPARISESTPPMSTQKNASPSPQHRFWDTENRWLLAGVGAARSLDYFSTLNMRRRGRQEILLTNDVVDNHPAFASIEAATAGVSVGASYFFHRHGHHKLERWTSFVHIGLTTTGAVRNYCLKTAHPKPAP